MIFGFIPRLIGISLIIGALVGFAAADMPMLQATLGGTIMEQLQWWKASLWFLVPIGGVLIYISGPEANLYKAFIVGIAATVGLWILTHPSVIIGGAA